ncbi:hypothetical protein D3C81_1781050 [compost metagenome]
MAQQQILFGVAIRITKADPQHEPVQLGFRKRIGALKINRILRRAEHKRVRQRIRFTVYRHVPFLHHLEQRGLRLSGGPVDLIGEQDIRHDRPRTKVKHFITRMVDRHPCNIAWQNIGITLDPAVFTGHRS